MTKANLTVEKAARKRARREEYLEICCTLAIGFMIGAIIMSELLLLFGVQQ